MDKMINKGYDLLINEHVKQLNGEGTQENRNDREKAAEDTRLNVFERMFHKGNGGRCRDRTYGLLNVSQLLYQAELTARIILFLPRYFAPP